MSKSTIFEKLENDIAAYGWHVISVFGDNFPNFSYTIGFTETLNHPEIIISGLDTKLAHLLLNDIGELIKNGQSFKHGQLSNEVLENYSVKFENVTDKDILEYFVAAHRHYGEGNFKALQCIWPNKDDNFQTTTNDQQEILS